MSAVKNQTAAYEKPYTYGGSVVGKYGFSDDGTVVGGGGSVSGGVNTLFVSGLPDDIKPREIHNLFRLRHGFESSQLKYTGRGNQVVAFATFQNHQSAMAALHSLDRVTFDPQKGHILHIELARSNSRRLKRRGGGPYVVIDKRNATTVDAQETSSEDGDAECDPLPGPSNHDISEKEKDDIEILKSGVRVVDAVSAENQNEPIETAVNGAKPCSTLFIANLGPCCTKDELQQVLSQYPGFSMLKVRDRGGMPVAFADFEEIEQANVAMVALQDSTLPSSDRGGMHIEFARNKMRKPKGDAAN